MPTNLENSAVATGLEKVSFHSNPRECSNYRTIALISAAAAAKLLQSCLTLCDPRDGSSPGSLSLGFSRQEHWIGTTQRDGMGREEGGGFRMGNTCIPVADSF